MKKHIVFDILTMWLLVFGGICIGLCDWGHIDFLIWTPLLIPWYAIRTWRWLLLAIDHMFKRTTQAETNGHISLYRERIYALDVTKKISYSVITFNDPKMKGKFIYLSNRILPKVDRVKVVFYTKSKVIKSIEPIVNEKMSKCALQQNSSKKL